ncbi:hypothetical protein [Actinocrispum wychmicini]|uniref:Uncharacterized protein n=1 Tax=Actinocrispum wychmicini TaxID=1213861 RepID=A0A4R2J742_9PSEU|nr:hypothetical protein [Actinocrispum wychmicini]TCO54893.1 hypothetical protein EV192_108181 [Actinocrispum wychmicini]
MRTSLERWPRVSALYGTGLGFAGGIMATIVASATGDLTAPVLMVAVVSAVTTLPGAAIVALQSWLLYASFIIGHTGQLALGSASLHAAILLGGTAVAATIVGGGVRILSKSPGRRMRTRRETVKITGPRPAVAGHR